MDSQQLIINLLLGGLLGILGQGIRVIIGLKKWYDDRQTNPALAEPFNIHRLWISILIGFVAGCLAVIVAIAAKHPLNYRIEDIIALIGAGYAGVDFIEGVVQKYLPKQANPGANQSTAQGQQTKVTP